MDYLNLALFCLFVGSTFSMLLTWGSMNGQGWKISDQCAACEVGTPPTTPAFTFLNKANDFTFYMVYTCFLSSIFGFGFNLSSFGSSVDLEPLVLLVCLLLILSPFLFVANITMGQLDAFKFGPAPFVAVGFGTASSIFAFSSWRGKKAKAGTAAATAGAVVGARSRNIKPLVPQVHQNASDICSEPASSQPAYGTYTDDNVVQV